MVTKKKSTKDFREQIVAKAIVDPAFRRKLLKSPEEIFGGKLTESDRAALERIKKFLPSLQNLVAGLAGEVLCGGGGGCGGLA